MPDPHARLRRLITERGIQPSPDPVMHPDGWIMDDPIGWIMDRAEKNLRARTPAAFTGARLDRSPAEIAEWIGLHHGDPAGHPWLRIHGAPGRGKTYAAWALTRAIVMTAAAHGRGRTWQIVTNVDLNDQLRPKPDESHAYAIHTYLNVDLLVLDDIGSGKASEWVTEQILRILNHRYEHRLTSIYTSNDGPEGLARTLDARVASRISAADVIIIDGPDRRHYEGDYLG